MKEPKKFAASILYFAAVLGICMAPLLFWGSRPEGESAENRTLASRPEITGEKGFNWNYLGDAGEYFTDHFAFREELVTANAVIRADIFSTSPVEDVIVGKNGWLYYEATLDDYQHKNGVSERMLFNIAHNMALMQEYSAGLGKVFVFTIAPNKNSLYDGNMPDGLRFQVGEESDAERLYPWLVRENVNYVDLFGLFEEQEEVLYYAGDSHWNEKGALMVYNALLDACGKAHETYEGQEPEQRKDYAGDLSLMLFPSGERAESRLYYPVDLTWNYVEGTNVEDTFIITENIDGEGNLLMYRDSFGNSLLPYMAQEFAQAVFSRQVPYPMSDLVTCEPDIVIVEKVERHLPTIGSVPPFMSAPVRALPGEYKIAESSAATADLSKENSYWKFEGTADPAVMDTDSRIYMEIDDGSGADIYEAFCVGGSGGGDETEDYRYILYISEIVADGDVFHVRLITEEKNEPVVLLEKEIHTEDLR